MAIEPSSANVQVDSTIQLQANVQPQEANNKEVTYTTEDTQYATVDKDTGVVTGVAEGQATIVATAKDNSGVSGQSIITVQPKPLVE
ncbi:Ig-like domain-containing protein [Staphylococcus delphini]|uniref:Ig-like domain-containing protein n=1 Tax=Staphylococcus delphini TaxID=53344 RepID=UPI0023AA325F|nr:Ig-like domain-containing protein [Staphylococcus delphini]